MSKETNKISPKELIAIIVISILLSIIIKMFFIQQTLVQGPSMENTLYTGDKVVITKIGKPEVGEVVFFKEGENIFVKRLIATEGDELEIKDNLLYINGELKDEKYIKEPMENNADVKLKLGKDEYYIMGDNRNNSSDSRKYGIYTKEDYIGKALFGRRGFLEFFSVD